MMRPIPIGACIAAAALLAAGCARETTRINGPAEISWSPESPTSVEGTANVSVQLQPVGGQPPYVFEARGATPPGLELGADGVLSGNPQALGEFKFDVRVADSRGLAVVLPARIRVSLPSGPAFPQIVSQRSLTSDEMARILGSREVNRMRTWGRGLGYSVNMVGATYITFDGSGPDMVGLPLLDRVTGKEVWGSVYLIHPFTSQEEALAYVSYPSAVAPTIVFYGGDGSEVTDHFNENHKLIEVTVKEGSGCGPTWEAFKKWLSSDSGAEGLPWWLDLLCGIACGDALIGTHNPWSISGCLHCVAAYIAACVTVGPTPAAGQLR